jgi:hypothetical protein
MDCIIIVVVSAAVIYMIVLIFTREYMLVYRRVYILLCCWGSCFSQLVLPGSLSSCYLIHRNISNLVRLV